MQKHVHHAGRLAEIDENKKDTHKDGRNGQKLAQNGDFAERLVVVQIVRQHQHDRRGGNTNQKSKLGDVQTPGNVAAHARNAQAVIQLAQVKGKTDRDDDE